MNKQTEINHKYGSNVHILNNIFLNSILAQLCSPQTFQPQINLFVDTLYSHLIEYVIDNEFPIQSFSSPTRMTEMHPDQLLLGERIDDNQKVTVVNLARAGIFPSHIAYHQLHLVLNPKGVRQDHIFASRLTAENHTVTGTSISGAKIGGDILDRIVMIPDPMGATGGTIDSAVSYYKNHVKGPAQKYLALHLIVTPEYLKKMKALHPDLIIYALRVDRGLSSAEVLKSLPGEHWDQEKGLNQLDYIVPGGGGFGEIMNNSFV